MSAVAIRAALEVALATVGTSFPTAWENAPYTPVVGTAYQRVHLLFAAPANPEMGGHMHTERGFLQVTLAYPLDAGTAAANARANLIRSTFYRGRSFSSGGITVHIAETPEIAPGRVEEDRYAIPVKIPFFSHVVRS